MRHRCHGDLQGSRAHDIAVPLRRVRLATGLVLMAYLTTHPLNHALGLMSLATMEAGRSYFPACWRNPVGTLALYGALATHVVLALRSIYQRRHFRMPVWEATQLLLGLVIPPLLASHVVGSGWHMPGLTRRIPMPVSSSRSGSSNPTSECAGLWS